MIRRSAAFALPFILAFAKPADAEPQSALGDAECALLRISFCSGDTTALRDAIALELRPQGVAIVEPPGRCSNSARSNVVIEASEQCSSDVVALRVVRGEQIRERNLTLGDIPEKTRPRVVALVLAELVELALTNANDDEPKPVTSEPNPPVAPEASRLGQDQTSEVVPPKTSPPPPSSGSLSGPRDQVIVPARPVAVRLAFAPEARLYFSGDPLFGARLSTEVGAFSFGASLLANEKDSPLGDVLGFLFHAVLGMRVVTLPVGRNGRLEAGGRFGAGIVSVEGDPSQGARGQSASELYLDGALTLGARREFGTWSAGLNFELGVARGVVALANTKEASNYGGAFAGALLSIQAPL